MFFMPEHRDTGVMTYIDDIYSILAMKDVAPREGITGVFLPESIIKFVASSIDSPFSAKKIRDTISTGGRKILVNTVARIAGQDKVCEHMAAELLAQYQ
ncbi:MAG: hypothetical protein RSF90_03575 [Pygmaiobacter sp.]